MIKSGTLLIIDDQIYLILKWRIKKKNNNRETKTGINHSTNITTNYCFAMKTKIDMKTSLKEAILVHCRIQNAISVESWGLITG